MEQKLDFAFISAKLIEKYADAVKGYEMFGDPVVPLLCRVWDEDDVVLALRFCQKDNPDDVVRLLYYPAWHSSRCEKGALQLLPITRVKNSTYLGKYIRIKLREENGQIALYSELRSRCLPLPEDIYEAEACFNAFFQLSSDKNVREQAWRDDKKIAPAIKDGTTPCYVCHFSDGGCWILEKDFCGVFTGKEADLTPVYTAALYSLKDGHFIYFTGKRFVSQQSEIMSKEDIRLLFGDFSQQYPSMKYYGHMIPVWLHDNPYWLIGAEKGCYLLVNPQTGKMLLKDKKELMSEAVIADPDDAFFFKV